MDEWTQEETTDMIFQLSKAEVWVQTATAYIRSGNSTSSAKAIVWADVIADAYEKRFLNNEDD